MSRFPKMLTIWVLLPLLVLCHSSQSSPCGYYEFPCNDGSCVDEGLWCDSDADCQDGSDEAYCLVSTDENKDPNNCSSAFFKCDSGHCIPLVGRCNGYPSCEDHSDETGCFTTTSTSESIQTNSYEKEATIENHFEKIQRNTFSSFKKDFTEAANDFSTFGKDLTEVTTTEANDDYNAGTISDTPVLLNQSLDHENSIEDRSLPIYFHGPSKGIRDVSASIHMNADKNAIDNNINAVHVQSPQKNSFVQFDITGFESQRNRARDWLLSEMTSDFDWGDETARAVIALQLSRVPPFITQDNTDLLVARQLELKIAVALLRNETEEIPLTDLALYINALSASCRNPKNFYGFNLLNILRQRVTVVEGKISVLPLIYLTLCANNETTYEDFLITRALFSKRKDENIGTQALLMLMTSCLVKDPLDYKQVNDIKEYILTKLRIDGLPGNVHEMALLMHAFNHAKVGGWGVTQAMSFILNHQYKSGSFGDILGTYYVLPLLSGKSLLNLNEHCDPVNTIDRATEELKYNKRNIDVQYSLYFGEPVTFSQNMRLQVVEGSNFWSIMRLAQNIDFNYRFLMDSTSGAIYSIGQKPNDAEKGLYWTLYRTSKNNTIQSPNNLVHFKGSVKNLVPNHGDKIIFWLKSIY